MQQNYKCMKHNQNITNNNFEDETIDIIDLLKKVWRERILITKATISFFIVGCLIALFSPVEYTSQTSFVPQVSGDDMSTKNNKLGSLASLAGINLNNAEITSDSYLSPLVYTNIVNS